MTRTTATGSRPRPTARIILAAAGLPIVLAAAGASLIMSWRGELPSRVATHWGTGGPDQFTSVATTAWLVAGFGVLFAAIGFALAQAQKTDPAITRVVAGTTLSTTAFVTVMLGGLVADQRGLADAADATIEVGSILGALAAGFAGAVVALLMIPNWSQPAEAPPADAPRIPVGGSELVTWTRSVAAGSPAVTLLTVVVGVSAIAAVVAGVWYVLLVTVVLVAVIAVMMATRVTVNARGLTVASALGWPKFHTPLDEISHAEVIHVHPIRHFAGYGFRIAGFGPYRGASGFIMRGGDGILLHRATGRRTVVVVGDAETGAGLINALVEREHSR